MKRTASAAWRGNLKDGKGALSTQSGILSETTYGFSTRFEDEPGTNPEELLAAAHAGCFTMALAALLEKEGMTAKSIQTSASVTLEKEDGGFAISAIHLDLVADIPGGDQASFQKIAEIAKVECPVSKLLSIKPTLNAKLAA
ncbi:MAG TPA: OsmC family protein [Azonexus sp.]|nr:OsmC family protein [Azonexus sp.]